MTQLDQMAKAAYEAMVQRVTGIHAFRPYYHNWELQPEKCREDWRVAVQAALDAKPAPDEPILLDQGRKSDAT